MTIFGNASESGLRLVTSLNQGFSCYITQRAGSRGGQSRSSLCAGIAARFLLKISLCVRSLSTSRTCTFAKECTASIITTAHYFSNFCILLSSYYNNPAYSTPNELWLESWISILMWPAQACTSFPLEPAARSTPASLTSTILLGIQQNQIYLLLKCCY